MYYFGCCVEKDFFVRVNRREGKINLEIFIVIYMIDVGLDLCGCYWVGDK